MAFPHTLPSRPLGTTPAMEDVSADTLLGLDGEDGIAYAAGDPDAHFDVATQLLDQARRAHDALAPFRRQRARVRGSLASLQWDTYTDPVTGEEVDEEAELREQNVLPVVHNRLRPLFRHLKGEIRKNASERVPFAVENADQQAVGALAEALKAVRRRNMSRALDADGIGELAMGGMTVRRATETWDDRRDRYEVDDDPVHPARFFFDVGGATDRRLRDVTLMGELLDSHPDEVLQAFAADETVEAAIRAIYDGSVYGGLEPYDDGFDLAMFDQGMGGNAGADAVDSISFSTPVTTGRWRVIRVWRREATWKTWYYDPALGTYFTAKDLAEAMHAAGELDAPDVAAAEAEIERESEERALAGLPAVESERRRDRSWVLYHLAPTGHVLEREEDVYDDGDHPYTVILGEFIDGEVRGFFDDVLDIQRQINRTYAQIDQMISAGAKGLWAIPLQALPPGMEKEEFADQFTRVGNILFYDLKRLMDTGAGTSAVNAIKSIEGVSVPAALVTHLQLMTDSLDKVSGMSPAQMGREVAAGTPAALYNQMVSQSSTLTLDLFETYFEGLVAHDEKLVARILQFWDDVRPVRGSAEAGSAEFDPEMVRDLTWHVSMGRVSETALYRQLFEQDLKELLGAQRLTLPQYLQESSHPRAQALLQLIQTTNPLIAGTAGPDQLLQFAAMAEAGDPDAVALLRQAQEFAGAAPFAAQASAAAPPTPNTA